MLPTPIPRLPLPCRSLGHAAALVLPRSWVGAGENGFVLDLTPFVSAIPAVGALLRPVAETFGLGLERRARRHAELLAVIPDGVDAASLRALLADELTEIGRRDEGRLRRKLDGANLAALIFVLVLSTAVVWALWTFRWAFLPGGSAVTIPRVLAVVVAVFAALLMMAGLGSLWQEADEREGEGGAA